MFDLVVIAVSAIAFLFVIVWLFRPDLRSWMEAPKHRMLRQEERYGRTGSAAPLTPRARARAARS